MVKVVVHLIVTLSGFQQASVNSPRNVHGESWIYCENTIPVLYNYISSIPLTCLTVNYIQLRGPQTSSGHRTLSGNNLTSG